MVKRISGLKQGPRVPPIFGGESGRYWAPIGPGDEVRCAKGGQELYIAILGVSADGWLLGEVRSFGELRGFNSFEVELGDLVEIRADRVLALLQGDREPGTAGATREISELAAAPPHAMA